MADEFICSDCGYASPDLNNQKTCPVCGGAIIETYGGIDKFEDKNYPDDMVDEIEAEDDELEDGLIGDEEEPGDDVAAPKKQSRSNRKVCGRSGLTSPESDDI